MEQKEKFELPHKITIADCESLHHKINQLTEKDNDIVLDASLVDAVDTAAVQLLAELLTYNYKVELNNSSETLTNAVKTLGLDNVCKFT